MLVMISGGSVDAREKKQGARVLVVAVVMRRRRWCW